ncbi:MAG: exo-alpha-sialidase [Candidatus Latescibacterota bacterium]|nr:MAG: exo-alpha-sialidase [Candidatus Latescibacterota bacterium]
MLPFLHLIVSFGLVVGCGRKHDGESFRWRSEPATVTPAGGPAASASLLLGDDTSWIAVEAVDDRGAREVRLLRLDAPDVARARFPGSAPSLARSAGGHVILCHLEPGPESRVVCRAGDAEATSWAGPTRVSTRDGEHALGNGRLIRAASGALLIPAVWGASTLEPASPAAAGSPASVARASSGDSATSQEIVLYASHDDGASWFEAGAFPAPGAADPVLAEAAGDSLVLLFRKRDQLLRRASGDGGRTWTPAERLEVRSARSSPALLQAPRDKRLLLAWVEPDPGGTWAAPALRPLRIAFSHDAGRTWSGHCPLLVHPGWTPAAPALARSGARFGVVYAERTAGSEAITCRVDPIAQLERACALPDAEEARARYSLDSRAAREALRTLCAHTLARPSPDPRLFVEAYCMRGFVAAYEALAGHDSEAPAWFARDTLLSRAIAFADRMVETQSRLGYWSLGYTAVYFADLGAAMGLFAALDPYIDVPRRAAYLQAGQAFAAAMQRDHAFLDDGAVATGWRASIATLEQTSERGFLPRLERRPYLVSTSLAGVEVHAWLFRHLRDPHYRDRALAALEFTLTQLQPNGSLPRQGTLEGRMRVAAYVQEGWMAADILLEDDAILEKLRVALQPHVRWLLRTQRDDGTWDTGAEGEFARTAAILDFLIWYDQRCEPNRDVQRAVRRGSRAYLDPARWPWLFGDGEHHAVLRAIAGRPLAAMAAERYFF